MPSGSPPAEPVGRHRSPLGSQRAKERFASSTADFAGRARQGALRTGNLAAERPGAARKPASADEFGRLGTSWANDPTERLVGVVLTTDMFTAAYPPPAAIRDFWTCVYAAVSD